jgi:ubiquinol-cytochrome c reductase cytochrome b subunit
MGLAIGYAVALSLPVFGANLASLIWDGPYPGSHAFESRMYIAHVFVLPALIATLIAGHLALVALRHHTQFRRSDPRASERTIVGVPTYPGQTPRSLGLMFFVAGALVLLGGLVQINPIWLWGPYHVASATNGAQPDWYLGWLIGALRLVPGFDLVVGSYTLVPNPFWGGALFPLVVFGILGLWPFVERRLSRDRAFHNLLDRPRDNPNRTAAGAALFTWVFFVFIAGASDRLFILLGISYYGQVWTYRVLIWVLPVLVFFLTRRFCRELLAHERIELDHEHAEEEARALAEEHRRRAAEEPA